MIQEPRHSALTRSPRAPIHSSKALSASALFIPLTTLALDARFQGGLGLFLLIHDRSGDPDGTGPMGESHQTTTGGVWKKSAGAVDLQMQAMVQVGERLGTDVSASMVSGSGTLGVLDGRGDYFTDIPANTGNLGLTDGALKLSFAPDPVLSMNLDLHTFHTTRQGPLSSRHLAEEPDVWLQYRFRGARRVEAGASLTWGTTAVDELGLLDGTGTMSYLMTSLEF